MKRLTKRDEHGNIELIGNMLTDCVNEAGANRFLKALNRLAEYEDAEEQGFLVWLPCKLGDTVWIKGDKFPAEIEEIRVTDDGIYFAYVEYDKGYEETEVWGNDEFTLSDIGKTVFLIREAAEKALEEA